MTSDEFFRKKAFTLFWNGIDTAFVDGLHTYEQSLKDVLNCVKYLRRGGTIVLHDCNPTDYHMAYPAKSHAEALLARQPDPRKAWCGEVWKTVVHLRSHFSNLNVCVLDCDYGIGLIRRGVSGPPLSFSQAEIRNMTYEELAARRAELLNLKAPEYLSSFLNGG